MSERVVAALGVLTGILVIAYGLRLWRRAGDMKARSIRVRGRVASFRDEDDDGGRVRYLPEDPSMAWTEIRGDMGPWGAPILTIIAGVAIGGGFLVWLLDG
jgi:hypothetical protein